MQLLDILAAGSDFAYQWPTGAPEPYPHWIDYNTIATDGEHRVRIGFGSRTTYGQPRKRVVVWIDGHPQAEFLGVDDFGRSGEIICEIKIPGNKGERICRYPDEAIPERYTGLPIVGLPTRVTGPRVHSAWAVIASVADHRTMVAVAALRRFERDR